MVCRKWSVGDLADEAPCGAAGDSGVDKLPDQAVRTRQADEPAALGAGGKIISPQSIAIATSAGNQQGKEGEILKAAIPYALTYVLITGIIVYIFS